MRALELGLRGDVWVFVLTAASAATFAAEVRLSPITTAPRAAQPGG